MLWIAAGPCRLSGRLMWVGRTGVRKKLVGPIFPVATPASILLYYRIFYNFSGIYWILPSIFVILSRVVGYSSSSFNTPYGDLGPLIDSSIVQGKINTYRAPTSQHILYESRESSLFLWNPKNAPPLPHKATAYPAQSSLHLHNFWRWGRPHFKVIPSFSLAVELKYTLCRTHMR